MITKSSYITGKLIDTKLIKDLLFDESLRRYEDLVFEHELKLRVKNYCLIRFLFCMIFCLKILIRI